MLDNAAYDTGTCVVFMPARNCEAYAAAAIESVARQTLKDIFVLYVDDASEDKTGEIAQQKLKERFAGRHRYIRNEEKFGKSKNIWQHLRPLATTTTFIAMLDADDQLVDDEILEKMAKHYSNGRDVVWTNYQTDTNLFGRNQALDPTISPRLQSWRTSHFFSFRADLLPNIPESYFKNASDDWFQGACDIALALPILDQTRNYEFMPCRPYRYTMSNPASLHNISKETNLTELSSKVQAESAAEVFAKPPLPLFKRNEKKPQPDQIVSPFDRTTDVIWHERAADTLLDSYPGLMTAQAVTGPNILSPLQLWSINAIMQRQSGKLLYIGQPDTAVIIASLVAECSEIEMTYLAERSTEEQVARTKLTMIGLSDTVNIMGTPKIPVKMDTTAAFFPKCDIIERNAPFSLIIIDARGQENEKDFSVLAFPALANCIDPKGFHMCCLTTELDTARNIITTVRGITRGMDFVDGGIGGTGVFIQPIQ